jgi:hypothetical protein
MLLSVVSTKDCHIMPSDLEPADLGLLLIPDPGVYGLSNALFPLDLVLSSLLLEVIANVAYPFALQRKSWLPHAVLGISAVVMVAATAFYGTADFGWTFANLWPALARIGFSYSMGILVYRLSASPLNARLPSVSGIMLAIVILAAFAPHPFAAGWLYVWKSWMLCKTMVSALAATAVATTWASFRWPAFMAVAWIVMMVARWPSTLAAFTTLLAC